MPEPTEVDYRLRIERFIAESHFLPPAFQLLPRLLLLLDDPKAEPSDLAEVIRVDSGLTADVLKICNSALFAGRYRINTVKDAILRIGFSEVYRILMGVLASPLLSDTGRIYGAEQPDIWNHSLLVATSAQLLAEQQGENAEVVFTAALLHDIGKQILNATAPQEYHRLFSEAKVSNQSLRELENATFGTDHAQVGAELLERWNFPPHVVLPVRFHHQPISAQDHVVTAAYIYSGNVIAYRLDQELGFPTYAANPDEKSLAAAGLETEDLDRIGDNASKKFSELQRAFS